MRLTAPCSSPATGCARASRPRAALSRSRLAIRANAGGPGGVNAQQSGIPTTPERQVAQAVSAIQSAWEGGVSRQRVELLLPLIGATDLDDWPGGIRQQFKAAAPLVEQILRGLKQVEGLKGPLNAEIWDDGDAVGAWYGENLAAVLFPTAPTLERLQQLAGQKPKVLLIVNPQWEVQAGLTSDFGFGDKKRARLEFVDSFRDSYCLKQQRITGDEVRILYAHPGEWRVFVVPRGGAAPRLLKSLPARPSYREVEEVLKTNFPESNANKGWLERLKDEAAWVQDSLKQPPQ
ncbi:MAG: hypothetical protein J3K34DRAFT_388888 [Monoraphidium minutum]|nr:MAG: hypothetical protein J3K34DRAFT_388888 [Monoraphidium minutum]